MAPVWLATHENVFRVGRAGERLVAEWRGVARLEADADGGNPELTFAKGVSAQRRAKIARGSARTLLAQLAGRLTFHGAAVAEAEGAARALVLLGASGRGKSTLSAAFTARGYRLLADDAVLLTGAPFHVEPTESEHWLLPDASRALGLRRRGRQATGKVPVPAAPSDGPAPLGAIVALAWGRGKPKVRREHGIGALSLLVPNMMRFVIDSAAHQRSELERLTALLETVPVFVLERARRFEELPAVVDMLADVCLKDGG